jgi:hypothetical protein
MKKSIAATAAILLLCAIAWAIDDTPANRGAQADRYLAAMPAKQLLSDMAAQVPKSVPAQQRDVILDLFKHIDAPSLEKAMKEALNKRFTADELKALADLCGTPAGKSAMRKYFTHMAEDVMPAIRTGMQKAQAKASAAAQEGEAAPGEPKSSEPKPNK